MSHSLQYLFALGVGVETCDAARLAASGTEPAAARVTAERIAREAEIVIVAALVRHLNNPIESIKRQACFWMGTLLVHSKLYRICSRALSIADALCMYVFGYTSAEADSPTSCARQNQPTRSLSFRAATCSRVRRAAACSQ